MSDTDVSKLALGRILASLTTGQTVAIIAFMVMLVTSGFSLGYWLAATAERQRYTNEATQHAATRLELARIGDGVIRMEADLDSARKDLARLQADQAFLQTKSQVLGLLVLFNEAEQQVQTAEGEAEEAEAWSNYQGVADRLFNVVMDLNDRSAAGEAQVAVRARLGKGTEPTLTFEQDGSTYPLPGIFKTAE